MPATGSSQEERNTDQVSPRTPRVTKHHPPRIKSVLPIDDGLLKMLCLAMMDIAKNGSDGGRAGDDLCPDGRLFR